VEPPVIEAVKNGWHALSRDLNLAVCGASPEEAAAKFKEAVAKPAPGGATMVCAAPWPSG
jgi:hypothetical protein